MTLDAGFGPLHSVVMASAGTGKTHALSSRLIALILRGCPVGSVLATTFTRKAAGEILERVLRRLAHAVHDNARRDQLASSLNLTLTRDRCRDALIALVRDANRLGILTLDSWMGRLATGFGLDLGLPPAWRIIDDREDKALRDQGVIEALGDSFDPRLVDVLEALGNEKSRRGVHRHASDAIVAAYDIHLDAARSPGPWNVLRPAPCAVTWDQARDAFARLPLPLTNSGTPNQNWSKAKAAILARIDAQDANDILAHALVARAIDGSPYSRIEHDPVTISACTPLIELTTSIVLERLARRNAAIADLLVRYERSYDRLKAAAGALRFDDIPRRLVEASLDGRLAELYYRLDASTHHLLLDEFQDTSRVQNRVIAPIADEILAQADASRSFFCVGDIKQSLYAWRGTQPEILLGLPARYPQIEVETLSRSYRSSQRVLDAVNEVFATTATNPAMAGVTPGPLWRATFPTHEAAKDLPGYAVLRSSPDADPSAGLTRTDQLTRTAAARVADLHQQAPHATIGVLVRQNARIAPIIHALRDLDIPAAEEGGARLTDSPVVCVVLSMLHLADFPGDQAARYHVGTSPLGRILQITPLEAPPARRAASRIRRAIARDGLGEFLARVQRLLTPHLAPRDFERLDRLVDLARAFEMRPGSTPEAFVEHVRETTLEDIHAAPVRVMTIHASKGLEFDAVVLPDLDTRWEVKSGEILTRRADDPAATVTLATINPAQHVRRVSPILTDLHAQRLSRAVDDGLCVLYVAMTRAKLVLEMIIPPVKGEDLSPGAAKFLRGAFLGPVPVPPDECLWSNAEPTAPSWTLGLEQPQPPPTPPPERQLSLVKKAAPTWKLPTRAPSSAKDASLVDVSDLWTRRDDSAARRGTLFHLWFARLVWSENPIPDDSSLLADARTEGLDEAWARKLLPEFKDALARVSPALARSRYASTDPEVRREIPFAVRDVDPVTGEAVVMTGQIDRLVVERDAARQPIRAEILDFKSDAIPTPEALAQRVDAYTPQMHAYRRAVAAMLALPPDAVGAVLLFTATGDARPV